MKLFDTHAHLLDERFDGDRDGIVAAFAENGIAYVMEACSEEAQIPEVIAWTQRHACVYGSAGVHPHTADSVTNATLDRVAAALEEEKILAVGEIGLDYHYDFSARDAQRRAFAEQLEIASAHRVPVILHDREAHGDMMDILRAHRKGLSGIMHCFSASYEIACECMDLGLYIAFGGAATFKNAVKQREIVSKLPRERLLLETDCPYMTPEPYRGTRNEPKRMRETLAVLAAARGEDAETLAGALFANALAVYGLDKTVRT